MIYYPKKYEQFTAALRLLYHKFIYKNGIKTNYLNSLKKIYEFEAINNKETVPINPENLCSEILTAVFIKCGNDFKIDTKNTYLINKKAFIALLLNLSVTTSNLEIIEITNKLVIKGKFSVNNPTKKLLKVLEGVKFKDTKTSICYLLFNFSKTEKESEDFEQAYYLLQNPLSVINLYLIDR